MITVTKAAQEHFSDIIARQIKDIQASGLNLRIQAVKPGTDNANIELSYCLDGEQQHDDLAINHDDFILYIDSNSKQALKNAVIDYKQDHDSGVGKVHIKAPKLKIKPDTGEQLDVANQTLFSKITMFLDQHVNPSLARHKGMVKLQSVQAIHSDQISTDKVEVILQFGGGCKGCSMIDFTLRQGIEKSLREKFPEVVIVTDGTDHASGKNPYCS